MLDCHHSRKTGTDIATNQAVTVSRDDGTGRRGTQRAAFYIL
jgi:hypothetical protein